jgi:hypothetical protein
VRPNTSPPSNHCLLSKCTRSIPIYWLSSASARVKNRSTCRPQVLARSLEGTRPRLLECRYEVQLFLNGERSNCLYGGYLVLSEQSGERVQILEEVTLVLVTSLSRKNSWLSPSFTPFVITSSQNSIRLMGPWQSVSYKV